LRGQLRWIAGAVQSLAFVAPKCCIRGDRLFDPEDRAVTLGQLRAYWIVMQLAAEFARLLGPAQQERFYEALKNALLSRSHQSDCVSRRKGCRTDAINDVNRRSRIAESLLKQV
jgi:hypothetical protein